MHSPTHKQILRRNRKAPFHVGKDTDQTAADMIRKEEFEKGYDLGSQRTTTYNLHGSTQTNWKLMPNDQ